MSPAPTPGAKRGSRTSLLPPGQTRGQYIHPTETIQAVSDLGIRCSSSLIFQHYLPQGSIFGFFYLHSYFGDHFSSASQICPPCRAGSSFLPVTQTKNMESSVPLQKPYSHQENFIHSAIKTHLETIPHSIYCFYPDLSYSNFYLTTEIIF